MNKFVKGLSLGLVGVMVCFMAGCATIPGGLTPSNTPLEGRSYKVLGFTEGTDSRICLLGIIPVSGGNHIRDALRSATRKINADALIEITVEAYHQYWILFSRDVTRVEGIGIQFTK